MTKLEYKMKVIEDLFIQHKNLTDKRIIDFNAHVINMNNIHGRLINL